MYMWLNTQIHIIHILLPSVIKSIRVVIHCVCGICTQVHVSRISPIRKMQLLIFQFNALLIKFVRETDK